MARLSFARMWTLIQNNYSTYFGKYRTLFPPELLAAIFYEETKFQNIPGVGNAVGFGQVQPRTIEMVNHFWEKQDGGPMTFQRSEILTDDQQSVQVAGLALAMGYEDRVERRRINLAGDNGVAAALDQYAGGHSEAPAAAENARKARQWVACMKALQQLGLNAGNLAQPDAALVNGVRNALIQDFIPPKDGALRIDAVWATERSFLFPGFTP
jgi:hypothetical protein